MDQREIDQMAADIDALERSLWKKRDQMRQEMTFWGDPKGRKLRGRLFEFFRKGKTLEVRRAQ